MLKLLNELPIKDTHYVTPFLKSVGFPSMAESGWLTRSLEQSMPYDYNYPGKITPKDLREAFLGLLFSKHFNAKYSCHGASRLPTLAVYAAYQCMMEELLRYKDKILCPLESHTSADSRSGQIGDIQINNADGTAFEGIEIKHQIEITPDLVQHAYEKFMVQKTNRYYLLTTANMDAADWDGINQKIQQISNNHGCQVIVNGVYSTLKYYLRLLEDPAKFIEKYVELLKMDENVKFPHQKMGSCAKVRG